MFSASKVYNQSGVDCGGPFKQPKTRSAKIARTSSVTGLTAVDRSPVRVA